MSSIAARVMFDKMGLKVAAGAKGSSIHLDFPCGQVEHPHGGVGALDFCSIM